MSDRQRAKNIEGKSCICPRYLVRVLTRKPDPSHSIASPNLALGAPTLQLDEDSQSACLNLRPSVDEMLIQPDFLLDSMNMAAHMVPSTVASQSTQVMGDTLLLDVDNMAPVMPQTFMGYSNVAIAPQLDAIGNVVAGTFDSGPFHNDLSSNYTHPVHQYPYDESMPSQLPTLQVPCQPPPSPAPRHHETVHGPLPSALYDEVTRFQAYIATVLPSASRIAIETEGNDGPRFVALDTLLGFVNHPGP